MVSVKQHRVAVLWRGDRQSRRAAIPQNNRFHRVFGHRHKPQAPHESQ
jgi:hypothetical protein